MKRLLLATPLLYLLGCSFSTGADRLQEESIPGIDTTLLVRGDSASLQNRVDSISLRIATLRGISFTRKVMASWVSRAALPTLLDSLDSPDTASASSDITFGELAYGLGYTETPSAYEAAQSSFSESAIAGFFISGSDHLWIVTDASIASMESTIAHELVHALQDQAFDLNLPRSTTMDGDYAQLMTIEGDAEYTQMLYNRNGPSNEAIDAQNDFLSMDELARLIPSAYPDLPLVTTLPGFLPYYWGPAFVHELRRSGGWPLVNTAMGNPPKSTHHTLVPADGIARSEFLSWSESRAWPAFTKLESWKDLGSDQIGQLMLGTLLMSWRLKAGFGTGISPTAWNGDRFWMWRQDSLHYAAAGKVAWKTETDAADFLESWNAASLHAPGQRLFRSSRSGSTVLLAWGHLDTASLDSLWKDLQDTATPALISGRAAAKPWPHVPLKPWTHPPRF